MKFIAVPILTFLIATQAFSKWVMLFEFQLNRDFISKNLCENRAKPNLKCGGKCQLMKAMEKEEKGNDSSPTALKSNFQEVLFSDDMPHEAVDTNHSNQLALLPCYLQKKYSAPVPPIFHPPA